MLMDILEVHIPLFEQYIAPIGVEKKPRLAPDMIAMLNTQIQNEITSSQIYRAMSCWLDENGWVNASKYFFKSADEEMKHMSKVYEYLFDKNCKAMVPPVALVNQQFADFRSIVEAALTHEMLVSKQWDDIAALARSLNDNSTVELALWFNKEQVEEEKKFRDVLFYMNLDTPKWAVDNLFK